jgi:hypothetical protein
MEGGATEEDLALKDQRTVHSVYDNSGRPATSEPYRKPTIPTNTSALRTASRHTPADGRGSAVKYAISTGVPPARITADSAAATNDRPTGHSRNSEV